MGILPIGFFSPLPLAMMIPFMATQSLAMGEAFGKSFQYGKRKISSMTNDEFNKLTFHDLMVEQTANIKAIIPELTKQMAMSKTMQDAIFREMVELIPTFFNSLRPKVETDDTTNTSQASPYPPIQEIRYAGRTEQDIAEQQAKIDALEKLIQEQFFEQRGTKESLAEKLAPPPPPPTVDPAIAAEKLRQSIPSKKVLSASEDPLYIAWIKILGKRKSNWQSARRSYNAAKVALAKLKGASGAWATQSTTVNTQRKRAAWGTMADEAKHIRLMSNDYRHPNSHIRENALRLRKEIARGDYKRIP